MPADVMNLAQGTTGVPHVFGRSEGMVVWRGLEGVYLGAGVGAGVRLCIWCMAL